MVAAVLSIVGVYGVLTYSVQARRRELGIRLAIGAGGAAIRRLVVGRAAVLCCVAAAIGLVGAAVLGRWLGSMLFEVDPLDPLVLAASSGLLVLTGLASACMPAIRAGRVDPAETLRHE